MVVLGEPTGVAGAWGTGFTGAGLGESRESPLHSRERRSSGYRQRRIKRWGHEGGSDALRQHFLGCLENELLIDVSGNKISIIN